MIMEKQKKIEIYVACHKPSEIPHNDLFVPIHVGAKNARITMPGMQRDDEGDNISEKNPHYCEMTAQYWAWKHSDADYIGLCHYRRYLSFSDMHFTNYTPDFRKQVLVHVLTPETEKKYGLLDKEKIIEKIEASDIVVADAQDLSKVYTPFGPQPTVLKHWEAHDMALINVEDLKKLFHIVQNDYPEIYNDMVEYMNGKYFYGFNTFVMRKDIFRDMCAFEFDVLEKLESQVDISEYNQQLSRIYGFMGEILFSSYVYHMKKSHPDLRLKECQMLYFDKTDPVQPLTPQNPDSIKIFWDITNVPEFLLYPGLATFVSHIDCGKKYEIILLNRQIDSYIRKYYSGFVKNYSNITLRFLDISFFEAELEEKYGKHMIPLAALLPWLAYQYDRVIYLKWNVMIQRDLSDLFNISLEGKAVGAAKDIYYQGKLNTFYKEDKNFAINKMGIKNIFSVVNDRVLLLDLSALRKLSLDDLVDKVKKLESDDTRIPNEIELFNALFQNKIKVLPQNWNCIASTNGDIRFYLNESPLELSGAWKKASDNPSILAFEENAPWFIDGDVEFYLNYWNLIRNTPLEELFNNHLIVRNAGNKMDAKQITWAYLNTIFPKGSHRREKIKKIFPKKGIVYRTLKKIMNPK